MVKSGFLPGQLDFLLWLTPSGVNRCAGLERFSAGWLVADELAVDLIS
jgi:hypothetical protein